MAYRLRSLFGAFPRLSFLRSPRSIWLRTLETRLYSSTAPNAQAKRTLALVLTTGICGIALGFGAAKSGSGGTSNPPREPKYGSAEDFRLAIQDLKIAFSSREDVVSTEPGDLQMHGFSMNNYHPGVDHSVVVYPESTEDVVQIVKIANKYRMPITPYGGATSLEGHFVGADADVVCQPGVGWMELNETLETKNPLFFPIDPAPMATIAAWLARAALNSAKTPPIANAVRYGTAKAEWFLNLTSCCLGRVLVTVRLAPVLPTTVASVQFPDVRAASGIASGFASRSRSTREGRLFFKFQGHSNATLREISRVVKGICEKHGGSGFRLAGGPEEAHDMWRTARTRTTQGWRCFPGRVRGTDVCVPVSRLPDLVYATKQDLERIGMPYTIVGHVGDGNFHALLLFKTDAELEVAQAAVHRMVERAIALDGTCTGEHGVGIGKREFLVEELGLGTVELMKTVKRAIDPLGLFNPGKLYPDTHDHA
ncbi:FAD-linked oxidase-like protein [Mycena sp. CBHHK59/15]|nr:FAD-linked oxidase-like protein [Mycena sp. CBHHK59/15]